MPTLEVFAERHGRIESNDSSYATARAGASFEVNDNDQSSCHIGQNTGFFVMQYFLSFDTSALPDDAIITSVLLQVAGESDDSNQDFTVEARLHDWGASCDSGDWVAGADLSTKTLLASFGTADFVDEGYNDFASESAFASNISKTGSTRMLLCSSRQTIGNQPSFGSEYIRLYTQLATGTSLDPKLTIEYVVPDDEVLSGTVDIALGVSGELTMDYVLSGSVGVAVGTSGAISGAPSLDFTVYDLYVDDAVDVTGYILHEDEETKSSTRANPIRAEKQDVGQNPAEQRPEFGDYFAQGDFSRGSGQDHFHHAGRDERKFFASEGFDISKEGDLTHLRDVAEALDGANIGNITQTDGKLVVIEGNDVRVGDGTVSGTYSNEDPHNGEGDTAVLDVTSRGDEIFAALGANGIHIRSAAGAWDHYQPDAATDLDVGTATKVEWLKDRLIVVGTAGREIFEVVADSTPTAMKTLPEGWTFESIFEAGAFIYAPAVNADAGLSRIHIFGLNSTASALEDKGSVPMPRGELAYAGIGTLGQVFIGGGRSTSSGGYDPVFYQAIQREEDGHLQLLKIAQGSGAGASDASVRCFADLGDAIVMGWPLGSGALTGARTGLAWYHLGRQAFAHHLRLSAATTALIHDISYYEGRVVFSVDGDGLYYEDLDNFVAQAYLISSIADWGTAGLKIWDQVEVSHRSLSTGTTVEVQYATGHPEEDDWSTAVISSTTDALGAAGRLSRVESRLFTVKLVSNASSDASTAPNLQGFSVRSNPTRSRPEFVLTRFIRLLAKDRKDSRAPVVFKNPIERRIALQQLLDSWVVLYEPGIVWTAFVRDVSDVEPAEPFLSVTNGEPLKEAYLVRLDMVATGDPT